MSISLFGICGLEWYWINKAVSEKAEEFDRAAISAMHTSVAELENAEVVTLLFNQFGEDSPAIHVEYETLGDFDGVKVDIVSDEDYLSDNGERMEEGQFVIRNHNTFVRTWNEDGEVYTKETIYSGDEAKEVKTKVIVTTDGVVQEDVLVFSTNEFQRKLRVIEDAMHNVLIEEIAAEPNIESRIGNTNLDSLLEANFKKEGIDVPFEFVVGNTNLDSVPTREVRSHEHAGILDFSVPLFPDMPNDVLLQVGFPSKDLYVLKSLGGVLIMVLIFSLLMMATFAKTLHAILKQKRLAEVKSDFINNMTHEFKTPLATIRLAVDSINHPRVKSDPDQITRFTGIIAEENKRLNGHVEKILQLAKMEKGDLVIKRAPIYFNQLVSDAVTSMELRVSAREGVLIFENETEDQPLNVDSNHMYNAMVNLIDNALKYSEDKPNITVRLAQESGFLEFTVQDHGIGMSNEVQKKAFDPFFRAQGGDVHNVKGFGVGLSYVREVVYLHHGTLIVKSTLGKGSTVGFKIPING